MREDKNTTADEDFKRLIQLPCFVCRKEVDDIKKHLVEVHFKNNIDDDMAQWIMDLDTDVDQVWEYSGTKGATGFSKRRGRRFLSV
jgi:hypothetical protein